jgi:hypothetical protein
MDLLMDESLKLLTHRGLFFSFCIFQIRFFFCLFFLIFLWDFVCLLHLQDLDKAKRLELDEVALNKSLQDLNKARTVVETRLRNIHFSNSEIDHECQFDFNRLQRAITRVEKLLEGSAITVTDSLRLAIRKAQHSLNQLKEPLERSKKHRESSENKTFRNCIKKMMKEGGEVTWVTWVWDLQEGDLNPNQMNEICQLLEGAQRLELMKALVDRVDGIKNGVQTDEAANVISAKIVKKLRSIIEKSGKQVNSTTIV